VNEDSAESLQKIMIGIEKILKTRPGLKFPKHRQFDKRGRKFI